MKRVIETAQISAALTAVVEEHARDNFTVVTVRPVSPMAYFRANDFGTVLSFEVLDALVAVAKRHGYTPAED